MATRFAIGSGAANTAAIVKACGNDSAAGLAASYRGGGRSDWHLPSRDELDALYQARRQAKDLSDADYWSSSQSLTVAEYAWTQFFGDGFQYDGTKDFEGSIRPIRAF